MRTKWQFPISSQPAAPIRPSLLLIIMSLALFFTPVAWAAATNEDISSIPLFSASSYDPSRAYGRGITRATDAFSLLTVGNLYKSTSMDTRKELLDVLNDPDLAPYFPTDEAKKTVAEPIAKIADASLLAGGLTNGKTLRATAYLVISLTREIVRRAMEGEGVADKSRIESWGNRLLASFQGCMLKTSSYSEASACKDAFRRDFPKNLGLALTYEVTRQNLGERYTPARAQDYLSCVTAPVARGAAPPRIRDCAIEAVREGTVDLVRDQLREASSSYLQGSRIDLVGDNLPPLRDCLAKAGDRAGFLACTDATEIRAGQVIVRERILNEPEVRRQVPEPAAREKIAENGARDFASCLGDMQKAGRRDNSGKLVTDDCEHFVTNRVAKAVSLLTFERSIREMLPGSEREKKDLYQSALSSIEACWSESAGTKENSACVAGVIKHVAKAVASARLDSELPAGLKESAPGLKAGLLDKADRCLEAQLPEDLLTSPDTNAAIDRCSALLLRSAALEIADFQLRKETDGNLGKEAGERLANQLVKNDFSSCLGDSPDRPRVDSCTSSLRQSAGKAIAREIFPQESARYLQGAGEGRLGISPETEKNVLHTLLAAHDQCIDSGIEGQTDEHAAQEALDRCYRNSMSKLAKFLGRATFRRLSAESLADSLAPRQKEFQENFDRDFASCIDGRNKPGTSPLDFKKSIEGCSQELSNQYAARIGRLRLRDALEQSVDIQDKAVAEGAKRLENQLNRDFEECLAREALDSAGRKSCVDRLERNATLEIVLYSERSRLKSQLNTEEAPASIRRLESRFQTCVQSEAQQPKACARDFVHNFALQAGSLKVRSTLGEVLGTRDFQAALPEIRRLEDDYRQCLGRVRETELNRKLLEALQACAHGLEEGAIALIQSKSKEWMIARNDSAKVRALKEEIAIAIPCLAAALPAAPSNESSMKSVNPDGLLRFLVTNISDYVSYDADKARTSFDAVLAKLVDDMKSAGAEAARADLVKLLSEQGVLDQLAKALVRKEIQAALKDVKGEDRPSAELTSRLLAKKNFDRIFSPEVMANLRPQIANRIIAPMLIQGRKAHDPEVRAATEEVKRAIASTLLNSPRFGGALLGDAVQRRMNQQDGFTQFFANLFYGNQALNWSYVRRTPAGQKAEAYITEKLLRPRFLGESLPAAEDARRRAKAEEMVKQAVKGG